MLGLTQQQIYDLIGVNYQQAHKYEKATNRIAAGRLYSIAQALGVEVSYFYEGLQTADRFLPSPQQQMLLDDQRRRARQRALSAHPLSRYPTGHVPAVRGRAPRAPARSVRGRHRTTDREGGSEG